MAAGSGTRWLSMPSSSDADGGVARALLRAWVSAARVSAAAHARIDLVDALVARACEPSARGVGTLDFGWSAPDRPFCAIELPVTEGELDELARPGGDLGDELAIAVFRAPGLVRVQLTLATRAPRAAIERALSMACEAAAAETHAARTFALARQLAAARDRETELAAALEEMRRRAEEAEGAAQRLAEVGRKKDEMLAVASHDVRSPVAAAKGALELLEPMLTELTDDQRHLLHVARRACDAVVHLAGNLLTTALIDVEDDEGPASDPRVDFPALVRDVVDLVAIEARRKGVQLELEIDDGAPHIRADLMWARQIIANLVNNGLKYTPKGGHVWVRLSTASGRAALSVDDEGVGIPADKVGKVFERLTKLRPRGTAGERGSGIGLFMTKQLVERLGGTIAFRAREGGGTHFVVELPGADAPETPAVMRADDRDATSRLDA
jgi:signal transduction histidine kinase